MGEFNQMGNDGELSAQALRTPASVAGRETTIMSAENPNMGDCKPENLKLLQRLMTTYVVKQRMKKPDRDLAKMILSLRQGHDGDKCKCIFPPCGKVDDNDNMELHHYDEIESHNQLPNLGPIHHNCHSTMHGKKHSSTRKLLMDRPGGGESERANATDASTSMKAHIGESEKEYTSREGEKHDLMRIRWNGWVHDPINGPFKGGKEKWRPGALAKKAVHALGMGSSVTYSRYIGEDYFGGIFDYTWDDAGYKYLVYLGPRKDKTNPV